MADVFLSYKREDAAKVGKLAAALRDAGLTVWWDEDIPPSAPWEATIEQALRDAKAVVVCWSPHAVSSENVRSEARVAREDGRLIQVFLTPCSPPLFFGERQGVDLSNWRGKPQDPKIAKIAESVRAVASGKKLHLPDQPKPRRWFEQRIHIALGMLILLAGSVAGWWLMTPAKAEGPKTLAVLPFRALNPADSNLVDAIWDDTRGAISRNPNLHVLGRQAVEALATKDLTPADYRRKVGADYLLDGSVEHVGDEVRMKLSLTRTSDGSEVWADEVGGKLDDVFAFQQRVAQEVEGRIRGRVAPGGGVKAQNIATSGEVYSIFAEAKAGLRKRNGRSAKDAIPLLKKALAIDPNYAPAWAELAIATNFWHPGKPRDEAMAEAVTYANRALTLAPNLANAHAALAMVQGLPSESEPELKRAIELDPGDAEAWMWLGSLYTNQGRLKEALAAHSRALEIEPLFWPAIGNKIGDLALLHDRKGMDAELARVEATGDGALLLKARAQVAGFDNQIGERVKLLLQLRMQFPAEESWVDVRIPGDLMTLGFIDEALKAVGAPPEEAKDYRGEPDSPQLIRSGYKRPLDFWLDEETPALFGRLLPAHGRLAEFIGYYRASFRNAAEFAAAYPNRSFAYLDIAPIVAIDLRAAGDGAQADEILADAETLLMTKIKEMPDNPGLKANLAQLRAAQGRGDEAIRALSDAFEKGWLPDRQYFASDIADEPCFENLLKRSDFQAIRQRILARIEEERAKVPVQLLAQAYPVKQTRAAA